VAAVLDRCLTEHLSRSPDLTGLSVLATQAVARSGAATPDGHEQAADAAVEAC
jgi:hypothetical protein